MPAIEDLEFVRFDEDKFPKHKTIGGPSPFVSSSTSDPSYIKPSAPLRVSGAFDAKYDQFKTELTPLFGREYSSDVRVSDIISDNELIRDLAITISRRGVIIFRGQDNVTTDDQKKLVQALGLLSGKPKGNGLHIHPVAPAGGLIGKDGLIDPELFFVSSRVIRKNPGNSFSNSKRAASGWHSDITFEPIPADYSTLKIVEQPSTGGDTLFANGHALLEKFSPSFRAYLETLTGTYAQPNHNEFGSSANFKLYSQPRGAPENIGDEFVAIHPTVRTNPVTGWKSLFAVGGHFTRFNEISPIESAVLKKFIEDTLIASHDIQLRIKWGTNDLVVWDNRSTHHTATFDYLTDGDREGIRTISIGERPYFDPNSKLQSEELLNEVTSDLSE